ncbi:M60 family metallopeptidase [Proteiniphilum sp.]|uniref:M60 family metallopeptidase n=1 Tax=Proteiniphilum sp. TaxID=1926877 RepID=UPI0033277A8A
MKNITVSPSGITEPGSQVEKIADGKRDADTEIFHTLWSGIPRQPVIIEAGLEGSGKRLDKIILSPRGSGFNGVIKTAEVWVMEKGTYHKVADLNAGRSNTPVHLELDNPVKNPEKIKLVITDAYRERRSRDAYMVSLGELECVMLPADAITTPRLIEESNVFADLTGTKLKPNVRRKEIGRLKIPALRNLATQLYDEKYGPGLRLADYTPCLDPVVLGGQMRIGDGFSKYEGITGIVLDKGENIVFVGETSGAEITLIVPEWTRRAPEGVKPEQDPAGWGLKSEAFRLQEGPNLIRLEKEGHAYIQYFTDDSPENHPPIAVHFLTGKVNGYFDITRGDTDSDFNALLENAVSPIMDMRGKHIQVAFPVDSLKRFTWNRGVELLQNFDSIVALQRHFIGWDKEGLSPENRVLARINYHYYMFRDGDGVAYIDWAMRLVADPESIVKGDPCWGFSHELGHVLQMRPQLTWGGMTEVSNNILTLYSTTTLGNRSRLSEQGIYAKARETILDKGISYLYFLGKDVSSSQYGGDGNTDVFHRLVPFWQLHLYFTEQGYPDFYPDLMIAMRQQEPLGGGDRGKDYLNMLEFCRLACEVSQTDLTDFFERWGFFYVGDIQVNDYGFYHYTVSQDDVDAVKRNIAAMNLPKPKKDIALMED